MRTIDAEVLDAEARYEILTNGEAYNSGWFQVSLERILDRQPEIVDRCGEKRVQANLENLLSHHAHLLNPYVSEHTRASYMPTPEQRGNPHTR